jgi:hypothetical protein
MDKSPATDNNGPYRCRQAWRGIWVIEVSIKKKWQRIEVFSSQVDALKQLRELAKNFAVTGKILRPDDAQSPNPQKSSPTKAASTETNAVKPKFRNYFEKRIDPNTGEIKLRIRRSGVKGAPTTAASTLEIVAKLQAVGVVTREWTSSSPGNVSAYHLSADFEDGGLSGMTGPYFNGPRGVWISGERAITKVCELLEVNDRPTGP